MAEQTNHVVAAVSQLEVDNFPFCILKYSAGFWKMQITKWCIINDAL